MNSPLIMRYQGLRRVISGGQDGVDLGALIAAKDNSVETGGMAPRGFRTAHGDDPSLSTLYALTEHSSREYPPRTEENVINSDGTLIIASVLSSPGTKLTLRYIAKHKKPSLTIQVPTRGVKDWDYRAEIDRAVQWLCNDCIEVLNVAGNHKLPVFHNFVSHLLVHRILVDLKERGLLVYCRA